MTAPMTAQVRYAPFLAVMTFLATTIALFFAGPFDWPIRSQAPVAVFLAAAMAAITAGYAAAVTDRPRSGELPRWRSIFVGGAVASCILIFPSAYVYTGKMPWDALGAVFDQGQAYRDFQARILESEGTRAPIVLVRTFTQWLVYAVIPLAVLHWRQLRPLDRALLAGMVLSAACFSLLRGTDQGTFDLGYLFGVSAFVALARHCVATRRSLFFVLDSRAAAVAMVAGAAFLVFAFNVFIERKVQRYDGKIENLCIGEERQICIDPRHALAAGLDDWGRFALGMTTAYTSQGYYGLALSLDREFQSTLGIGHSTALTRVYEAATGDTALYERSFTYQLRQDAWSDLYQWSTLYTWIANDIGFVLTIPLVGLLAAIWGASWRDAVGGGSDAAAIVFCMMTQTFIYSPANFQLVLVSESYAALLIWIALWRLTTQPRARATQPASAPPT